MTFVPWEEYNICKWYALPKTICKDRPCRFNHPPKEELRRIWDLHDESKISLPKAVTSDRYARPRSRDFEEARGVTDYHASAQYGYHERPVGGSYRPQPLSSGGVDHGVHPDRARLLPPQAQLQHFPSTVADTSSNIDRYGRLRFERATHAEFEYHDEHSVPRPRELEALQAPQSSYFPAGQRPGGIEAADIPPVIPPGRPPATDCTLPERLIARRRAVDEPYEGPARWIDKRSVEEARNDPPVRNAGAHEQPPTRISSEVPADQNFNPVLSSNEFINGASIYTFVWGKPLCVRCGEMGHLPKAGFCKNEPLSMPEQDYLYRLMRAEQARSKQERPKPPYSEQPIRELSVEPQSLWQRPTSYPDDREPFYRPQSESAEPGRSNYWQRYREQKENSLPQPDEDEMGRSRRRAPVQISHNDREHFSHSQSGSGRPDQSSYWQQSRAQKQRDLSQCDKENMTMTQAQESTPVPTGHKRNFNDFSDFLDGTRDERRATVPSRPDEEVKIRGMSQVKKEASVKVEVEVKVEPPPALAPIANFVHPSRAALVPVASPLHTTPPLLEASVPLDTLYSVAMGATKRMSNGEAKIIGPHPSTLRVSASYITQAAIDKRLAPEGQDAQERSIAEAREDTVRLQGVAWLDNVRRHLQLPVKTFTTAVVYYHKFRLAHPKEDYQWIDAAAASLLTSCKNEDTLKKSRDILAAAYNMKLPSNQEQAATDDPMFETQSKMVIGIERLILESGGFDFRSRAPHHTLVKIGKSLPKSPDLKEVSQLAWTVLTDLHRTFAPLKQTSSTLALASLELAAHFTAARSDNDSCIVRDNLQKLNVGKWHTTREEVMETLLDALDLYTHNTGSSILGSKYSLEDLLRIRLALNKECSDSSLPRYTVIQPPPSPDNANDTSNTLRVANGHPTPVSPPQPGAQAPQPVNAYTATSQHTPQTDGTLRFMLNPQRATEERAEVNRYYTEEWEEYEEEIEVPLPRDRSREREREGFSRRDRDSGRPRDFDNRRNADDRSNVDRRSARDSPRAAPAPPREPKVARQSNPSNMLQSVVRAPSPAPEIIVPKDDDKDNQRDRDRDSDRHRDRPRSRDRDRRHDSDRRHDDRDRYDSRKDRGSRDGRDRTSGGGNSRRHYDDDRRRDRR